MPANATPDFEGAARRYPQLRRLTADEVALISAAVEAGALFRRDDAYLAYIEGRGGLPVRWSTYVHCEDSGNPAFDEPAKREAERRDAFVARCTSGDLRALVARVQAGLAGDQAEAA